jgi:hypothetical protein
MPTEYKDRGKALVLAVIGGIFVSIIAAVMIYFLFEILGILFIFGIGLIIITVIASAALFIISAVAFFYYFTIKKPNIMPGEYKLEEEKGKNE